MVLLWRFVVHERVRVRLAYPVVGVEVGAGVAPAGPAVACGLYGAFVDEEHHNSPRPVVEQDRHDTSSRRVRCERREDEESREG